ncbi:MAG: MMPL family transporter [Gammaproteobacteria bacterium]
MSVRVSARLKFLAWFGLLALLCTGAAMRLNSQRLVDTNLLDLLPASRPSPLLNAAIARTRAIFLRELLLVVSATNHLQAKDGARAARGVMASSGLAISSLPVGTFKLIELYRQHHYAFLTSADRARLIRDPVGVFTSDLTGELANPIGSLGLFGPDFGGYLSRYLTSLPRPYPNFIPDGPFMTMERDGKVYYLLQVKLSHATLGASDARIAVKVVAATHIAVKKVCRDCKLLATGAALFAASAQREARSEVFWFTTSSMLFIALLIVFVFRSLKPLILGVFSVLMGVLGGAAAVIISFGSIQILTLVCGTTLLGIAIDYAFLYFSEHWFGKSPVNHTLAAVLPGLTMGLVTSVFAFAFLLLAGFPALTQIAIFSIAGLLMSYLSVVMLFPSILRMRPNHPCSSVLQWPQLFLEHARERTRWRYAAPLLLLAFAVPGLWQLRSSDAVRELQNFPKSLIRSDQAIHHLLGQSSPPGFFLVRGRNIQQALRREEMLFKLTDTELPATSGIGLSRFLPSISRQTANLRIWEKLYHSPARLKRAFVRVGLPAQLVKPLVKNWKHYVRSPLEARSLLTLEPKLGQFVVRAGERLALIASLNTPVKRVSVLKRIASHVPGVSFVAPLERITGVFKKIRVRVTWLVLAGYLLISLLLILRYGRHEALRMLYPLLLSLVVTLGALGWLNQPVNIFVIVGLILVLGIGRDYSVFLREGSVDSFSTALGVTLAALATFCSFGMLTLSSIPALHAFGLTTLIGITVSYLTVPLGTAPKIRCVR